MDLDPLAQITDGCWLALRLGLRVSAVPTGNLRVVEGVYIFGAERNITRWKRSSWTLQHLATGGRMWRPPWALMRSG